jgi:Uma2 family endonuclease
MPDPRQGASRVGRSVSRPEAQPCYLRPVADPAQRVPDFDELYERIRRLPEYLTGEILEPGVIRTMSRPGSRHQFSAWRIRRSVGGFDIVEDGSGCWFEMEREVRFGARLAVPDIAGWKAEREPVFVEDNPITVPPDWCCEVLSPSTERDDRQLKLPLYARSGVGFTWLVDPELRSVEVYETRGDVPALVATAKDDDTVPLPPFDSTIEVARYWKRARRQS